MEHWSQRRTAASQRHILSTKVCNDPHTCTCRDQIGVAQLHGEACFPFGLMPERLTVQPDRGDMVCIDPLFFHETRYCLSKEQSQGVVKLSHLL